MLVLIIVVVLAYFTFKGLLWSLALNRAGTIKVLRGTARVVFIGLVLFAFALLVLGK